LRLIDVSQEDSGNYTCEVRGPQSTLLGHVTHYLFVRGTAPFASLFLWRQPNFVSMRQRVHHHFTLMRFKLRFSNIFSAEGWGCLAESRGSFSQRIDCGHYGSFTVFAVYLRFLAVLCGCKTAENRGLNVISVKEV